MSAFTGSALDHLNITVSDLDASRRLYDAALGAIGIDRLLDIPAAPEHPAMIGYGRHPKPFFWIVEGDTIDTELHVAFTVETRELARDFFSAALEAGGASRREPGLCPEYHPNYYGAFITDLDGHNVEAVCHEG